MKQKIYVLNGRKINAKKFKKTVRKYQASEKGQITINKYKEEHKEQIREYNKNYLIDRRNLARINKNCISCNKKLDSESIKNHNVTCKECRKKIAKNARDRKRRRK